MSVSEPDHGGSLEVVQDESDSRELQEVFPWTVNEASASSPAAFVQIPIFNTCTMNIHHYLNSSEKKGLKFKHWMT